MTTNNQPQCPLCEIDTELKFDNKKISIYCCAMCASFFAVHKKQDGPSDYHQIWEGLGEGFVSALKYTRMRQAQQFLGKIKSANIAPGSYFDFGAGKGWFLDYMRGEDKALRLAATDGSQMVLDQLRSRKYEVVPVQFNNNGTFQCDLAGLAFNPEMTTFFDVIEHFPSATMVADLQKFLAQTKPGSWVTFKIPRANGLLFRLAWLAAKMGNPAQLEQLFQVGTYPPHNSYLSEAGLVKLCNKLNLKVRVVWHDAEFDPACFADRVGLKNPVLRGMATAVGYALHALVYLSGQFDSVAVCAQKE